MAAAAASACVVVFVSPRFLLLGSRCRKSSSKSSLLHLNNNKKLCSSPEKKKAAAALIGTRRRNRKTLKLFCRIQGGDSNNSNNNNNNNKNNNKSNGEEPPESLFMKELKRRGMTPTSVLEEKNTSGYNKQEELKFKQDDKAYSNRTAVSTDIERDLSGQRERSMQLNSEGLEGLVPRAKLLLTLGGTFFLAFWPLILITATIFSVLYFYFGPSFVHDGSNMSTAPPPYIDPYTLLDEERGVSQSAPLLK